MKLYEMIVPFGMNCDIQTYWLAKSKKQVLSSYQKSHIAEGKPVANVVKINRFPLEVKVEGRPDYT